MKSLRFTLLLSLVFTAKLSYQTIDEAESELLSKTEHEKLTEFKLAVIDTAISKSTEKLKKESELLQSIEDQEVYLTAKQSTEEVEKTNLIKLLQAAKKIFEKDSAEAKKFTVDYLYTQINLITSIEVSKFLSIHAKDFDRKDEVQEATVFKVEWKKIREGYEKLEVKKLNKKEEMLDNYEIIKRKSTEIETLMVQIEQASVEEKQVYQTQIDTLASEVSQLIAVNTTLTEETVQLEESIQSEMSKEAEYSIKFKWNGLAKEIASYMVPSSKVFIDEVDRSQMLGKQIEGFNRNAIQNDLIVKELREKIEFISKVIELREDKETKEEEKRLENLLEQTKKSKKSNDDLLITALDEYEKSTEQASDMIEELNKSMIYEDSLEESVMEKINLLYQYYFDNVIWSDMMIQYEHESKVAYEELELKVIGSDKLLELIADLKLRLEKERNELLNAVNELKFEVVQYESAKAETAKLIETEKEEIEIGVQNLKKQESEEANSKRLKIWISVCFGAFIVVLVGGLLLYRRKKLRENNESYIKV